MCKQCNENKIEDENHLLFECKAYTEKRLTTFQFIQSQLGIDISRGLRKSDNLKILFPSNNINAMSALGKFGKQSFEKRQTTFTIEKHIYMNICNIVIMYILFYYFVSLYGR